MIIELIRKKLKDKLTKEQHNVLQLEWQKAELERRIELAKKKREVRE